MGKKDEQTEPVDPQIAQQIARCGQRLAELRSERGWTLEELAERSDLSKPYLSRLEAGDRRPSIAAILTLARVFSVSVGEIFESTVPTPGPCVIVRKGQTPPTRGEGIEYQALSSAGASAGVNTARLPNLQALHLKISADRTGDERYHHDGEEWVYVLSGRISLSMGEAKYELDAGDSAHFDSRVPHRLMAIGGTDAEAIVVACPLSEGGAGIDGAQSKQWIRGKRAVRQ